MTVGRVVVVGDRGTMSCLRIRHGLAAAGMSMILMDRMGIMATINGDRLEGHGWDCLVIRAARGKEREGWDMA